VLGSSNPNARKNPSRMNTKAITLDYGLTDPERFPIQKH
jgi:hypothetical protein